MLALVLSLATGQWSLVGSKTTKMAQHTSEWSVYLCTARSSLFGGFPLVQSILRAKLLPPEETTASSLGRFTVPQTLRYGRVVVFCKCYDWDDLIVTVRPFKKVAYTPEFSLPFVLEGLGGVESIKHTEIVSIIGRIEKPEDTKKVTYLVRNRAESSLEVSPGSLDSVLW